VAYGHLGNLADGTEQHEVVQVQVVARVHAETQLAGIAGSLPIAIEYRQGLSMVYAELGSRIGERAGATGAPRG